MTLVAHGITKRFSGIVALAGVDIEVGAEEAVGLIGPNGAGKTTLFNCVLGITSPDEGTITYGGADLGRLPIHKRAHLGVGRTFQRMELFTTMSPREHLHVTGRARATRGGVIRDLLGRGRPTDDERERAAEVLDLVGLSPLADEPVEALSLGQGRLVELARALMCAPSLLLLDEPSSGLDRAETERFAEVLRSVRAEHRTAMLIVEHDLPFVLAVADRLYVLDCGALVTSGRPDDVLSDPRVREAYLGMSA